MDRLITKIRKNVRSHGLIAKGGVVLVAVSGGVDSMVLLDALRQLSVTDGFKIAVAHFNHQLRGRASDLDEKLVRKYCTKHGLTIEAGKGDVKGLAKEKKISIEMAARELRIGFLGEAANRLKCDRVALAHHADDQVELFFIRLFRGSGGDGLSGMGWSGALGSSGKLKVVRPLLDLEKKQLVKYAKEFGVSYREDATNRNTDILRNRVRKKLVPQITELFGEAAVSAIERTMEVVGGEADLVRQEAESWLGGGRRLPFNKLHLAIQRQIIRQQLWQLEVPESFDLIEELRIGIGDRIQVDEETFLCCQVNGALEKHGPRDHSFRAGEITLDLSQSQKQQLFGSVTMTWEREAMSGRFEKPKPKKGAEVFDAEKVGTIVRLRFWRPGDRFQPLGMSTPLKLQDWFVNLKVPMERRRQLLVAETEDGRIFWVEGQRIGEQFKLDKDSRHRLKWQWHAVSSK